MTPQATHAEPVEAATLHDATAIAALEDVFESGRWSLAAWEEEIASPRCHVLVQRIEDAVVGVAAFSIAGDIADLNRVLVAAHCRRAGIARGLVEAGIAWAAGRCAQQIMLEVEASNEPAKALYEQTGFVPLATRENYYGPGRDAKVLARPLKENA